MRPFFNLRFFEQLVDGEIYIELGFEILVAEANHIQHLRRFESLSDRNALIKNH